MKGSIDYNLLAENAIAGETKSFETLYKEAYGLTYSYVVSRFGTGSYVEDIVSETLIKVWRSLESFTRIKGDFIRWLFSIAFNTGIDFFRRNQNKEHLPIESAYGKADQDYPGKGLSDTDAQVLRTLINQLPINLRTTIVQRIYLDQSNEYIAAQTGTKLGTVKSHYRIALERLRKSIVGNREDWL